MKTLIITTLTLASLNLHAETKIIGMNQKILLSHSSHCVAEYMTQVSESTVKMNSCYVSENLKLSWKSQYYPNFNQNPRTVQYWTGGYAQDYRTEKKYLRELIDICRGKIISSKNLTNFEYHTKNYNIENPNLDPSITESFMLVPMTESEAESAFQDTHKSCLKK